MQQKIEVFLPVKPLSTNDMWMGRKRRSFEYQKFRRQMFKALKEYSNLHSIKGNMVLIAEVGLSSAAADLSNTVKAMEDVLMEYFKLDDKHTVDIHLRKFLVYRGDEFIKVKIHKSRRKNVDLRKHYKRGDNVCGI